MKKRMALAVTAASVAGLGVSAAAASAADYLYYSVQGAGGNSVGRVELDGTTGRNDAFASFGSDTIRGLAATDSAVYVVTGASQTNPKLTRVDSSGAKTDFFGGGTMCPAGAGASDGYGPATDGAFVYYICESGTGTAATRYLARVSLDGATHDAPFSGSLSGIKTGGNTDPVVGGGYAYFNAGPASSGGADRVYRVALTAGATAEAPSSAEMVMTTAWSPAGLFAITGSGMTRSVVRFPLAGFPGWSPSTVFPSISSSAMGASIAGNTTSVFWVSALNPATIVKANADGSGTPNTAFLAASGMSMLGKVAVVPSGPGGSTPTPAPAPTPTPTPTPAATTLATPTVNTSAPGQNAVVTVRTQLGAKGKYTFIFEKPSANEMSREQATSNRVAMQKGTRIGTRRLKKAYTAAVITTTADNAKVVTRALLRKAQAKKLNLRVVYAPTGTAQSESVIKIK